MKYIITFLEGFITFISPCLLPMLPIYVSYFAGGEGNRKKVFSRALAFVLGFTSVFVSLGALAGSLGSFLKEYRWVINIVSGVVVIFFGLSFLGIFKLNIFKGSSIQIKNDGLGFFSALLFGIIFSLGWTPCVGAFLGSALMLVAQNGHVLEGVLMLLVYSAGLGIPFIVSAVLIDYLKTTFDFIKRHYRIINIISGTFLIIIGILMATGTLEYLFGLLG